MMADLTLSCMPCQTVPQQRLSALHVICRTAQPHWYWHAKEISQSVCNCLWAAAALQTLMLTRWASVEYKPRNWGCLSERPYPTLLFEACCCSASANMISNHHHHPPCRMSAKYQGHFSIHSPVAGRLDTPAHCKWAWVFRLHQCAPGAQASSRHCQSLKKPKWERNCECVVSIA
jgi:hypothetical protein